MQGSQGDEPLADEESATPRTIRKYMEYIFKQFIVFPKLHAGS